MDQAAREQQARQRQLTAFGRGNGINEKLRLHRLAGDTIVAAYDAAMERFFKEDEERSAAFGEHSRNVLSINRAGRKVRYNDLVRWYKHVPDYVRVAQTNLARYLHEDCRLSVHLNELDRVTGRCTDPLSEEEQQAAYGAEIMLLEDAVANMRHVEERGYGLEIQERLRIATISNYSSFIFNDDEDEAQFVRAAFDLRKIRLEHEGYSGLRFPDVRPFRRSIDFAVLAFILIVRNQYFDSAGQWIRENISDALAEVLDEMQQYGHRIVRRCSEIQRLQPLISQKSRRALELDMATGDESADENDLPGMLQEVEETVREVEDLQAELAEVIEDTMAENPYDVQGAASHRPVTGVFS